MWQAHDTINGCHVSVGIIFFHQGYIPHSGKLREFVCTPPPGKDRLHCTIIRHGDETSGGFYVLYLEHLGGLIPLLKGKRASKLHPDFIIYDPQAKSTSKPGEMFLLSMIPRTNLDSIQVSLLSTISRSICIQANILFPGWFLPWECNLICCTSQAKGSRTLTLAARQVCSGHTQLFVLCIGSQSDITLKSILISCLPCLLVASSMKLFSFW